MIFILHRNDHYVPGVPRFQHETLLTNFFRQSQSPHFRIHSRTFIYTHTPYCYI